ncbi:MAG: hypothetical protein AB7Y46_11965 [Armatimonadota bacterium]
MIRTWGRCRRLAVSVLIAVVSALAGLAQGATLLSSSLPGAFGVRYFPDRTVISYTVDEPGQRAVANTFRLRVRLPQPVRWGFLDREPIPAQELTWVAEDSQVVLALPFGSHRLHLGWAGEASLPPERAVLPVTVDGREVGRLIARFTLSGMEATGEVPVGPGSATLRIQPAGRLDPDKLTLTVGGQTITRWRAEDGALVPVEPLLLGERAALSLRVQAYGLAASPIARIAFADLTPPAQVRRVAGDTIPEGAILVEAEAFIEAGGTEVQVDPGSHYDTHGGACVFSFIGDGSWLEWELPVPADGRYDQYARTTCGDTGAIRQLSLDGNALAGHELVALPGTGGWGHAEGEWWLVRFTGQEGLAPALALSAGPHRLRMTGVLEKHLNLDYLLLVPRE